ncbi:hypothetical protein FGADI_7188 [Fusarium gaditjirri]|uniref:ChrR-like cupin domain-containing protein n=1 Tax=Fusarium gaditjirri TaxID=282569 RepID=A0A8H4T5X1_9HYPO|nr:hypothetical protein FGADI_7188 [Fusarium gaditjirri]
MIANTSKQEELKEHGDQAAVRFRIDVPAFPPFLVVPGIFDFEMRRVSLSPASTRRLVPTSTYLRFRRLLFQHSSSPKIGILSLHRHASCVYATVLKGRRHYLEHSWWATEGGYAFEPPEDIHTLKVPGG